MADYVEAPKVTLDNTDPTLHDGDERAFIDAENDKAAAMFSQIAAAGDEPSRCSGTRTLSSSCIGRAFSPRRRC